MLSRRDERLSVASSISTQSTSSAPSILTGPRHLSTRQIPPAKPPPGSRLPMLDDLPEFPVTPRPSRFSTLSSGSLPSSLTSSRRSSVTHGSRSPPPILPPPPPPPHAPLPVAPVSSKSTPTRVARRPRSLDKNLPSPARATLPKPVIDSPLPPLPSPLPTPPERVMSPLPTSPPSSPLPPIPTALDPRPPARSPHRPLPSLPRVPTDYFKHAPSAPPLSPLPPIPSVHGARTAPSPERLLSSPLPPTPPPSCPPPLPPSMPPPPVQQDPKVKQALLDLSKQLAQVEEDIKQVALQQQQAQQDLDQHSASVKDNESKGQEIIKEVECMKAVLDSKDADVLDAKECISRTELEVRALKEEASRRKEEFSEQATPEVAQQIEQREKELSDLQQSTQNLQWRLLALRPIMDAIETAKANGILDAARERILSWENNESWPSDDACINMATVTLNARLLIFGIQANATAQQTSARVENAMELVTQLQKDINLLLQQT